MPTFTKQHIKTLISMLISIPTISFAASPGYLCHHGDQSREILVEYDVPGQRVPCGVLYRKATGEQELWRANDEEGYCEARAREFASKQEAWGWQCSELNPSSSEPEPALQANDESTEPPQDAITEDTADEELDAPEAIDDTSSQSEPMNDAANLL